MKSTFDLEFKIGDNVYLVDTFEEGIIEDVGEKIHCGEAWFTYGVKFPNKKELTWVNGYNLKNV